MNNKTLVYCPSCGGEGRVMEANCNSGRHTEVWEECYHCNGDGTIEYAYFKELGYNEDELEIVETPIVENFQIY